MAPGQGKQGMVQPRLAGHGPTLLAGVIEACRLEAREPAGVRLGGSGDAVGAEKEPFGLLARVRWIISLT
jgi:hypothetical protein